MVVQRGMPRPPSLHDARLRDAPDEQLFGVITNGYGVMYSYASRVPPPERWAIYCSVAVSGGTASPLGSVPFGVPSATV